MMQRPDQNLARPEEEILLEDPEKDKSVSAK